MKQKIIILGFLGCWILPQFSFAAGEPQKIRTKRVKSALGGSGWLVPDEDKTPPSAARPQGDNPRVPSWWLPSQPDEAPSPKKKKEIRKKRRRPATTEEESCGTICLSALAGFGRLLASLADDKTHQGGEEKAVAAAPQKEVSPPAKKRRTIRAPLTLDDAGVDETIAFIRANPKDLDLSKVGFFFEDEFMELIFNERNFTNLRTLVIGKSEEVTRRGFGALAKALRRMPKLEKLTLASHLDEEVSMEWRARADRSPNPFGEEEPSEPLHASRLVPLFENLSNVPNLTHLDVSGNELGTEDIRTLAGQFSHLSKLQHLDISRNPLSLGAGAALAARLRDLPALRHFDANGCNIGNEGVAALATRLPTSRLVYLGLAHTLGNDGLNALTRLRFPELEVLDLSKNDIDDEGLRRFSLHLRGVAPKLRILKLHGNDGILDAGVVALAEHLRDIPRLEVLELGDYFRLEGDEAKTVLDGVALRRQLTIRYVKDSDY